MLTIIVWVTLRWLRVLLVRLAIVILSCTLLVLALTATLNEVIGSAFLVVIELLECILDVLLRTGQPQVENALHHRTQLVSCHTHTVLLSLYCRG